MNQVLYIIFKIFSWSVQILPERWRWMLGKGLGKIAGALVPSRRKLVMDNMLGAGYAPEKARRLAGQAWESLGLLGAEFVYYSMGHPEHLDSVVQWEGEERLNEALARKKGVILACAHLGNWELLGTSLVKKHPIIAIARDQNNTGFNQVILDSRHRSGIRIIPLKTSLKPVISALRRNEIAIFMVDQRGKGGYIPFFGREARFYLGAATFALRTGAAILPARFIRVKPGQFRLIIDPEIVPVDTGHGEDDAQETTALIMNAIEKQIRETPEQWLWMHKLWKKRG